MSDITGFSVLKKLSPFEKEEKEEEEEEESVTKGRVLRLTGFPKQGVGIDAIKTLFGEHQRPEWVDYNKGDEEVCILMLM